MRIYIYLVRIDLQILWIIK